MAPCPCHTHSRCGREDTCSELISKSVQGQGATSTAGSPLGPRKDGEVSSLHILRGSQLSAGAQGWAETPRSSKAMEMNPLSRACMPHAQCSRTVEV